jgi:hypothetical protein
LYFFVLPAGFSHYYLITLIFIVMTTSMRTLVLSFVIIFAFNFVTADSFAQGGGGDKGGNSSRDRSMERAEKNCYDKVISERNIFERIAGGTTPNNAGGISARQQCDIERYEKGDRAFQERHNPPPGVDRPIDKGTYGRK